MQDYSLFTTSGNQFCKERFRDGAALIDFLESYNLVEFCVREVFNEGEFQISVHPSEVDKFRNICTTAHLPLRASSSIVLLHFSWLPVTWAGQKLQPLLETQIGCHFEYLNFRDPREVGDSHGGSAIATISKVNFHRLSDERQKRLLNDENTIQIHHKYRKLVRVRRYIPRLPEINPTLRPPSKSVQIDSFSKDITPGNLSQPVPDLFATATESNTLPVTRSDLPHSFSPDPSSPLSSSQIPQPERVNRRPPPRKRGTIQKTPRTKTKKTATHAHTTPRKPNPNIALDRLSEKFGKLKTHSLHPPEQTLPSKRNRSLSADTNKSPSRKHPPKKRGLNLGSVEEQI